MEWGILIHFYNLQDATSIYTTNNRDAIREELLPRDTIRMQPAQSIIN